MNPIKKLFAKAVKSVINESTSNENAGWTIMGGTDEHVRINKQNLMDANKNWVYVAINKIATNVSQARLKLLKYDAEGTDEEVLDHEGLLLLARPSKYFTGKQLIEVTIAHLKLTGNAYWLMVKEGSKIKSIFPLNPKNITLVWSADYTEVVKYKFTVGARVIEYQPDQIFHLKTPDVNNPLLGKGTLEGIAEWVDVDNYITEFNRRFFINGATFGSAIETEASSQTTLATLKAQIADVYTGVKNAFKVFILPKGSKFVESKMTMKDMDMSEGDNRYRDKILSGFGVPKSVLGITEAGSSRADAEAKNYAFQEFTIKPILIAFTDYLTEFFLPVIDPKNASKLYFSFEDPTPDSKELKLNEDKTGLNNQAFLTVNEVRASRGLPAVAGGDVVMFQPNQVPLGTTPTDPNASDNTDPVQNQFKKRNPRPMRKSMDEVLEDLATKAVEVIAKAPTDRRKVYEEEHKTFIARTTTYEDNLKIAFVHFDRHQAETVKRNLHRVMKSAKAVSATDIVDTEGSVKTIIDFATPLLGDLYKEQANNTALKLGTDFTFDFNASAKKLLEASIRRMAKKYTRTTLDLLTTQLNEGIKEGESLDQLTERVQTVYGLSEEYRAARVARTETFSVANDASRQAYVQSGIVKSVEWYTAEDELVCEYCGPMDGVTVGVTDSFFSKGDTVEGADGGSMDLNYETVKNPPLHANCRCEIKASEISIKKGPIAETKEVEDVEFLQKMLTVLEEND